MTAWLTGRRALVVGGGSGIGRAVVDAFLAEGAQVGVLERDQDKCLALSRTPGVVVVNGDATIRIDNDRAVATVDSAFGGLDVLVCCVGVFDFRRRLDDIAAEQLDEAFDELFAANVKSTLHSVQASLPALRRSGGSVILTESTSAYFAGRGGVLYTASKFAVRGLVLALAHELAPEVRVNGVAPGSTMHTDLAGPKALGLAGRRLDGPDRERAIIEQSPLRVALTGEDHAWSYVFLASSRSRGVTGDVLHTDGGMTARAG